MHKETKSRAYFTITSQLPLDAIEAQMGGPGDGKCWSIGDQRRNQGFQYKFSRWSLLSGVAEGKPIDEHLISLWRKIEKYRLKIIDMPKEMHPKIACTGWFKSHRDSVVISSGHFATAGYYQLNMDFDFYFDDDFGYEESDFPNHWEW